MINLYIFFVVRPPLWKYLGIKFEDIVVKPHRLTIKVKSIELYPLQSPILRGIFVAIFPSANVSILQKSDDYPESKISIHKMKIKLRIGTAVGTKISDTVAEVSNNGKASSTNWILRLLYYVFPRPVIDVDMVGVTFEIEKSYIAPDAPSEFHNNSQSTTPLTLPSAVVSSNQCGPEIPTFDQDYWLDFLRNDEILDADNITFLIERWINHAVSKLKKKQFQPDGLTATEKQTTIPKDIPVKERTDDEKTNVLITSIAEALCHSLSFRLSNASVIISGADSAYVKMIRKKFNPRRANIMLAKLPRRKRALTIIGADVISISFSPDVHCNLLFYFLNVYVKVGNPIPRAKYQTRASGASSCRETLDSDVQYAWHSIAHPFHLVAEIIGVVPFLTWILNYDHYWETRSIGVNISTTEVNVTLTPEHLHTVFLHLDDYTDPMSPLNEWLAWLNKKHLQTLGGVSENEKLIYSHNFARIKGTKFDENETLFQDAQKLSSLQMKDMEKRMTRHEIISLRCIAMEKKWRIPKENEEFSRFLRQSRSRINEKNDRNQVTPLDAPSPFQRIHPSPLGALVTLIIGNNSFFSPLVTMNFTVKNLHLDFPYEQDSARKHIPSSITVTGVSFGLKQTSPFFSLGNNSVAIDSPRPFLNLKFQAQGIEWNVLSTDVDEHKLPAFRDGSIVGLIYKVGQIISNDLLP